MSVIVNNRSENVLAVFLKACDLFTFTVNTVHNEKYFKKRTFASLGKPIVDLAQAIMAEVHYADETDNETETGSARRLELMDDIAARLSALQANVNVNALKFHLTADKAREWTIVIEDFKKAFNNWRKTEKTRLLR